MLVIVYALMYVLVPAILLGLIGGWTFLVYAVWLVWYLLMQCRTVEQRTRKYADNGTHRGNGSI